MSEELLSWDDHSIAGAGSGPRSREPREPIHAVSGSVFPPSPFPVASSRSDSSFSFQLGDRGANTRIQKITAILWQAKLDGQDPAKVADEAVERIGLGRIEKGRLTSDAMVRNVAILERLGCTEATCCLLI